MNTHRSRLSNLSIVIAMVAVTLLVTVLSLQARNPAYALPANIPALAPQDVGPTVVATVTVGSEPAGVGVNPTTNRAAILNLIAESARPRAARVQNRHLGMPDSSSWRAFGAN